MTFENDTFALEDDLSEILTPALAIRMDAVDRNIARMRDYLQGRLERWRPHIKTVKLRRTQNRLLAAGVRHFKAATTREVAVLLELADEQGFSPIDLLHAYPLFGANLGRFLELSELHEAHVLSTIVDSEEGLAALAHGANRTGSKPGVFIDVNAGMNRTGVPHREKAKIEGIAHQILADPALIWRGLHWYDGHIGDGGPEGRRDQTHRGLDQLRDLIAGLKANGIPVEEVVTSGTPGFLHSLSYEDLPLTHQVSPGTVVYWDAISEQKLEELDFEPAAVIVSRIVSRPEEGLLTCDAGHKTLSADCGDPAAQVMGRGDLEARHPSEEHLPLADLGSCPLRPGDLITLVPTHVCPTVNNADRALIVRGTRIVGVDPVDARGHEVTLGEREPT